MGLFVPRMWSEQLQSWPLKKLPGQRTNPQSLWVQPSMAELVRRLDSCEEAPVLGYLVVLNADKINSESGSHRQKRGRLEATEAKGGAGRSEERGLPRARQKLSWRHRGSGLWPPGYWTTSFCCSEPSSMGASLRPHWETEATTSSRRHEFCLHQEAEGKCCVSVLG